MATVITVPPTTPALFDGASRAFSAPLPIRRECPDIPPPFEFPGGEWNCNLCGGDADFCMPWEPGDVIPLAFALPDDYNADATAPMAGWTDAASAGYIELTLFDHACNVLLEGVDNVSTEYYVRWCEATKQSNQIVFFDTSLLPLDVTCFKIGIKTVSLQGETVTEIVSNLFCKNGCDENLVGGICSSNVDTVLIQSQYNTKDCFSRCYGQPNSDNTVGAGSFPAFYNAIRVPGVFNFIGAGTPQFTTTDAGFVLSTTTSKIYRLETFIIPPYMACWIASVLESDGSITINGQTFDAGNVSLTTTPFSGMRALKLTADLFIECENDNTTCT